jgi:hypothetical protein
VSGVFLSLSIVARPTEVGFERVSGPLSLSLEPQPWRSSLGCLLPKKNNLGCCKVMFILYTFCNKLCHLLFIIAEHALLALAIESIVVYNVLLGSFSFSCSLLHLSIALLMNMTFAQKLTMHFQEAKRTFSEWDKLYFYPCTKHVFSH